jgi:hypothetical protein
MKKISLFLLMIFSACVLFAQEAPKEEPKNEVKEEPKTEAVAEAQPAEAAPEAAKEEPTNVETLPETSPQEEPKNEVKEEQQPDTAAELEKQAEESHAAVADGNPAPAYQAGVEYYRPYLGVGVPLVVLGSISVLVLMPAMGAMAFAASDGCKDKDWDFCEQCRNDHHTAWTTGAVLTGVLGAGMIVTGSWLITVQKPRENQVVRLNNFAVMPTKKGMMASVGFKF